MSGKSFLAALSSYPRDPTLTFLQATNDDSNLTTYTWAGENFGTASEGRYIIAVFGYPGPNPTVSSCTIGGVSATKAHEVTPSTATTGGCSIWIALVPTGTSGTISVTMSAAIVRIGRALYSVTNLFSPVPTATSSALAAVSGVASGTIAVQTKGIVVGVSYSVDAVTGFTWTGLTEDSQVLLEASANEFSSASTTLAAGSASLAWSATDGAVASRSPFAALAAFR